MRRDDDKLKSTTGTVEHDTDLNRDPLTGEPGSHPVGTGVGAATGAATGAAIGGAVGGPPGALLGAAIGGVAGGFAGKGVAEAVNPTEEDAYWRENYKTRPYAASDANFTYEEDYRPAYRYGWESRSRHKGKRFEDVESDLGRDWDRAKDRSRLSWDRAKEATRDAWHRVERAIPGDADRDGR